VAKAANISGAAKGDLSLPAAKDGKKKWLYIAAAIIVLLAIIYYATSGFTGLAVLWPD
jgi:hypothetical protein